MCVPCLGFWLRGTDKRGRSGHQDSKHHDDLAGTRVRTGHVLLGASGFTAPASTEVAPGAKAGDAEKPRSD